MTMMSALVGRRRPRDSEADVETQIYVRPQQQPMAWDRVMVLEIMKGLETRLPRVVAPPMRVLTPPPRVIMTRRRVSVVPPPGEPAAEETLVLEGRPRKVVHKTKVPWLLFVMAFGIAFGVGQDRQLRRELGTKLRVTTTHAAVAVARHVLPGSAASR